MTLAFKRTVQSGTVRPPRSNIKAGGVCWREYEILSFQLDHTWKWGVKEIKWGRHVTCSVFIHENPWCTHTSHTQSMLKQSMFTIIGNPAFRKCWKYNHRHSSLRLWVVSPSISWIVVGVLDGCFTRALKKPLPYLYDEVQLVRIVLLNILMCG